MLHIHYLRRSPATLLILVVMAMCAPPSLQARSCGYEETAQTPLKNLSLEALMNIEITSMGKKPQALSRTAAPVFVITNEDIRRSGVTSIADAMRMVPGMHVSQLNAHAWAISARGFNSFFANKMVVLRDGRNVYSSTYGGVYWDEQDMLLEDIDRIEVIRGPAGTIWGANAVNGVINIITKCASDTQGDYFTAGIGKEDRGFMAYRHGGKLKNGYYRAYIKAHDYDGFADNSPLSDEWRRMQAGFRGDVEISSQTTLNISGDFYRMNNDALEAVNNISESEKIAGANLMAKWSSRTPGGGHLSLQTYLDHTHRQSNTIADITVDVLDVDFQHHFIWGDDDEFTWGIGYRYTMDDIKNKPYLRFTPPEKDFGLISGFIQNQFQFDDGKFLLTVGSKFEHNDFTGTEIQPSIRAIWSPRHDFSIWASASHAAHTVSRAFTAVDQIGYNDGTFIIEFLGDRNLDSEYADVLELGIRGNEGSSLSWDLALFYSKYNNLLDTYATPVAPNFPLPPYFSQVRGKNDAKAVTKGAEISVNWRPTNQFNLQTAYTYLQLEADSADDPVTEFNLEGRTPRHQLSLRPSFNLTNDIDLDFWIRYVDDLRYKTITQTLAGPALADMSIDDHIALDARIAWRPNKTMELALVGQNLLEPDHIEFGQDQNNPHANRIERNIYVQLRWDTW